MSELLYGKTLANMLIEKAKESTKRKEMTYSEVEVWINQHTTKGKIGLCVINQMICKNSLPTLYSAAIYAEALGIDVSEIKTFKNTWRTVADKKAKPIAEKSILTKQSPISALPFNSRVVFKNV